MTTTGMYRAAEAGMPAWLVRQHMDPQYVCEWPTASMDWAIQLRREHGPAEESRSLVDLELGNVGDEVWLVSNPDAVREAFESGTEEGCLDDAARVARNCLVLEAHWGNDVLDEPDEVWLEDVVFSTRPKDRERVRWIIREQWNRL